MHIHLFFDGATKPRNPAPSVGGALLIDAESGETLRTAHKTLEHASNNEAEYWGLISGLEAAIELGATHVTVHGDSQLVIEQVWGKYGCYKEELQPLNARAKELARHFGENIQAQHIKRAFNAAADAFCERVHSEAFGGPASAIAGRSNIGFVINLNVSDGVVDERKQRHDLAKALRAVVEHAFPLASVSVTRITE